MICSIFAVNTIIFAKMFLHKIFITLSFFVLALTAGAKLTFTGMSLPAITCETESSSGLEELYVINSPGAVTISYTAASADAKVEWFEFGNQGASYATALTGITKVGNEYSYSLPQKDTGIAIYENDRPHFYRIINYANHQTDIQDITPYSEDGDCDRTALNITGNLETIHYYSINGRAMELPREINLTYNTLEYDEGSNSYIQKTVTKQFNGSNGTIRTDSPLCDTQFTISADRFLRQWKQEISAVSETYTTKSVAATCSANQSEKENDNEQKVETTLGGSAPIDINFTAAVTDAAIFHEWQFSHTAEFEDIYMRVTDLEFTQTFNEEGTTYIRFVAGDANGTCYYYSDVYEVMIGESALDCPNAFSPGSSEGINDEWKVSYKSIVEFECHIFNRWGNEITSFRDPAQGWDGKKGGKLVPSGVYYYVIKAVGADGKKYELAGDINIINSSTSNAGTATQPTE